MFPQSTGTINTDLFQQLGDQYLMGLPGYGNAFSSQFMPPGALAQNLATDPTLMQQLFGGRLADGSTMSGWVGPLLGIAQAGLGGWLGMKQLDLAKDTLNFQKDAFSKQFENQRTLTNSAMRDRQAARVASNPTAYQSVDEYMKQNGV